MKSNEIIKNLDKMIKNPKCSLNYKEDYELLIAVMLSARTTDEQVNQVTKKLFKYSLNELNDLDIKTIENIIRPLGNMRKKSEYIKDITNRLLNESNGHVLNDREFLESLKGIGHKSANLVLNMLYDVPTFAVDTHVLRVSKILGITSVDDNVYTTERKLMSFFPKSLWGRTHHQLVLFGRHICKSNKPLCSKCEFYHKCKNTK